MWRQLRAIAWAQWRTLRNHGPETRIYAALLVFVSLIWYGIFVLAAVFLARFLPRVSAADLQHWFGPGLFVLFLAWQSVPLFTVSGGWTLQLDRLQVYPLETRTLFATELCLRCLMSADMATLIVGASAGLLRNPHVPILSSLLLLSYIPFNTFVASSVRASILFSFGRYRLREAMAVALLSLGVLPQLLLRTSLGPRALPYLRATGNASGMPWTESAHIIMGEHALRSGLLFLMWLCAAGVASYRLLSRALTSEQLGPGKPLRQPRSHLSSKSGFAGQWLRFVPDPVAALIEKEVRFLLRTPRFRVVFGMACVFSIAVFLPLTIGDTPGSPFVRQHFLPTISLYGVLLLGDVLMWNVFGFEQAAAAIYFTSPVGLRSVLIAKNTVAASFVLCQTVIVLCLASALQLFVTPLAVLTSLSATAVVTIYFLAIGNLLSVLIPRPVDPRQTLRKQAGASIQIWLLVCVATAVALIGFAALWSWALDAEWPFLAVLAVEFCLGVTLYRIALDSAVERGLRRREVILQALSRSTSPLAT